MRKWIFLIMVLLISVVLLSSATLAEKKLIPIRIAYHNNISGASLVSIAQQLGYFKQEGLDPKFFRFTSGPPEITAMIAGDLDVGFIGPGAMFLVMEGRVNYIAVDSLATGDMILGYPGKGVKTVKNLENKKIGVALGTSEEMLLRVALKVNGLSFDKVQVVPMSPENQVAAFSTGQLDAVATYSPYTGQIRTMMPDVDVVLTSKDLYPKFIFPQGWIANTNFMAKNPEGARRFIRAIMRANTVRLNGDETVSLTSKFSEVPADLLRKDLEAVTSLSTAELKVAFKDGTVEKWLNSLSDIFVEIGRIKAPIPTSQYFNKKLFLEATKNLK